MLAIHNPHRKIRLEMGNDPAAPLATAVIILATLLLERGHLARKLGDLLVSSNGHCVIGMIKALERSGGVFDSPFQRFHAAFDKAICVMANERKGNTADFLLRHRQFANFSEAAGATRRL